METTCLIFIVRLISRLTEIDIVSLTVLFCNWPLFRNCLSLICNCPLLKDSFNTKCLLVWRDYPVITCLFRAIFGINHFRDFWKIWNYPRFTQAIPKFLRMHSGTLSQITLPSMWLLVLIFVETTTERKETNRIYTYHFHIGRKFCPKQLSVQQ